MNQAGFGEINMFRVKELEKDDIDKVMVQRSDSVGDVPTAASNACERSPVSVYAKSKTKSCEILNDFAKSKRNFAKCRNAISFWISFY